MSLRIRRKSPVSVRLTSTLIAIFALVIAPMYGVVESQVANAAANTVSGEFTNPAAEYKKSAKYDGIAVDVRVKNVSELKALSVTVNRSSGGAFVQTANPGLIDIINGYNGAAKSVTAPIVIYSDTYASSSWSVPADAVWDASTVPEDIDLKMTFTDNTSKTDKIDIKNTSIKYADVVPADTTPPTIISNKLSGGEVVDGVRYVRPSDKLKYTVEASDPSGLDRAANKVFKLKANGTSQDGIVCGSWHNGAFPANSNISTGNFNMKDCNGGVDPADGLYGLAFRVYDNADNNKRIPNAVFTVDGTQPEISEFSIDNSAAIYTNEIKVSAKATDTNLKDVKFYISKADSTYPNGDLKCTGNGTAVVSMMGANVAGDRYEAALDTSSLTGKNYCVNAVASDYAKNHSNRIGRQLVTIDNTAPQISSVTFNGANFESGDALRGTGDFVVNMTEKNPRKAYVEVQQLINGEWEKIAGNESTGENANSATLNFDTTGRDENAKYQLKISSDDQMWNHGGSTMKFSIDNTKLSTFDIKTPADQSVVGDEFTVTGVATDDESGIDYVEYMVKSVPEFGANQTGGQIIKWTKADYANGEWNFSPDVSKLESGKFYQINVKGLDKAGNYKARNIQVQYVSGAEEGGDNTGGEPCVPGITCPPYEEADNDDTSGTGDGDDNDDAAEDSDPFTGTAANLFATPLGAQGSSVLGLGTDTDENMTIDGTNLDNQSSVLGAEDENDNTGCFKLLGLCWYYWVPIIVVVAVLIAWWAASRRRKEA